MGSRALQAGSSGASWSCVLVAALASCQTPGPAFAPLPPSAPSTAATIAATAPSVPPIAVEAPAGAPPLIVLAPAPGNAGAVAVDDTWVYWIDQEHGLARVSKRDGGTPTSLARPPVRAQAFGLLALDGTDVYWTLDTDGEHGIWRIPKDARLPASDPKPFLSSGASDVGCLAVDADAVYWMQVKGPSWALGGSIRRAGKDGRAAPVIATYDTPGFGCLALDDARLYWLSYSERRQGGGTVKAVPKRGGSTRNLAAVVAPPIYLKVDRDSLYWVEAESIMRASKDGRPATTFVAVPAACGAITEMALDDAFLYFACGGVGPRHDAGSVWRAARAGGALAVLADGQAAPAGIAVDADFVYWAFRGTEAASWRDGGIARLVKPPAP
jgi:hypothetical protein